MNITTLLEDGNIEAAPLAEALSERYLSYALSTIMSRSLPDVRDGLKPVQRRILYAMHELRLNPEQAYKKAARVVGDVIGKFHPHGDVAVYDALVRLAQDFASRYPLVDGQGNFGNVDGDSAAAMRYTEARLTDVATALLEDIDQDTVDFLDTYDGSEREPVVLPANFPNLLANGATGIAVGMATSIPPHNVEELCEGLLHLIKAPNARTETLLEKIPAPDFPTGGCIIADKAAMLEAYETGRGSVTIRARWEVEDLGRGQFQIVVTEIPYQVTKARLMERAAELIMAKKLNLIADIEDESAEDVRIVITPKSRTVDPAVMMETLFKQSEFESRFSINLNVIDKNRTPQVMGLRQLLQSFLDHRRDVLQRKSRFRLGQIASRLEILNGYLVVYLNLDKVIQIIREEDEPKPVLMKAFKLTENQAEAILNMRLRALRKLEEMKIREDISALEAEEKDLEELLSDEAKQWARLAEQIKEIKKKFGKSSVYGGRRSEIIGAPAAVDLSIESFVEKEPVTVVCSEAGWIRAMKGHGIDPASIKYKEGDRARFIFPAYTTDQIIIFSSDGKFFTLAGDKLPSGRGFGEPLSLSIDIDKDAEIIDMFAYAEGQKLLLASTDGRGFITAMSNVLAQTRTGKQIMTVSEGARAVAARICAPEHDHVAVVGTARKLLVFPLAEMSELNKGRGIILQKYKQGRLTDIKTFTLANGLTWENGGKTYTLEFVGDYVAGRATQGTNVPRGFPASNKFNG